MRGSWLDFDFDHKDILYVRIDRRRKMPATILFKAMGMTKEQILDYFYTRENYILEEDGRLMWEVREDLYRKDTAYTDIVAPDGTVLCQGWQNGSTRRVPGERSARPAYLQLRRFVLSLWKACSWLRTSLASFPLMKKREFTTSSGREGPDETAIFPQPGRRPKAMCVLAGGRGRNNPGPARRKMTQAGIRHFSVLHTMGTDTSSSIRDTPGPGSHSRPGKRPRKKFIAACARRRRQLQR